MPLSYHCLVDSLISLLFFLAVHQFLAAKLLVVRLDPRVHPTASVHQEQTNDEGEDAQARTDEMRCLVARPTVTAE